MQNWVYRVHILPENSSAMDEGGLRAPLRFKIRGEVRI